MYNYNSNYSSNRVCGYGGAGEDGHRPDRAAGEGPADESERSHLLLRPPQPWRRQEPRHVTRRPGHSAY